MPSCCYADEYGDMFSPRQAARTARRYLRRGLRGTARDLADAVLAAGVEDATVLEVGGGVGEIHVDLLRRGAAGATNVELSPGYEAAAAQLLEEAGLGGRVDRRVGDFVDAVGALAPADVVLLHRVVCCYPDWQALVASATSRTRRVIGLTVPADHRISRLAVRFGNALLRLRGRSFRAYVHPVDRIVAALEEDDFRLVADHRGRVWHTLVAARRHAPAAPGDQGTPRQSLV
jgi:SAM-dependent methyltransferase